MKLVISIDLYTLTCLKKISFQAVRLNEFCLFAISLVLIKPAAAILRLLLSIVSTDAFYSQIISTFEEI